MRIRMFISLTAGVLAVGLFLMLPAKTKSDFSGTWVRDEGNSDAFTAVVAPIIGSNRNSPGTNFILRINHRDQHLQVAVEQNGKKPMIAYYDLGSGWHGGVGGSFEYELGAAKYRTKWTGDNLVIYRTAVFRGNYGMMGGSSEQKWALSPGGNILTVITAVNQLTTKEVFERK
jgi:hypothetical protein